MISGIIVKRSDGTIKLVIENKYDALGRRIARIANNEEVRYVYDGEYIIAEIGANDSVRAAYCLFQCFRGKLKTYLIATLYAFFLAEIMGFSLSLLRFQQEFLSLRFHLRSWDIHFGLLLLCSFLVFLFFLLARGRGQDILNKARRNAHIAAILANVINVGLICFLLINSPVVERLDLIVELVGILSLCIFLILTHLIFLRRKVISNSFSR